MPILAKARLAHAAAGRFLSRFRAGLRYLAVVLELALVASILARLSV
jgi:hypothetical protein